MINLLNWVIPRKGLVINFDQWKPGNPLWVTGSSGDGKSTVAWKLARQYHAEVITSDIVLCRLGWTEDKFNSFLNGTSKDADAFKMKATGSPAMDYVMMYPELPHGQKDPETKCIIDSVVVPEVLKFYKWLMTELESNPKYRDKLYIIEGCDICKLDPEVMKHKPLILLGGSRLISFWRRVRRNCEEKGCSKLTSIRKYMRKYNIQNKHLDLDKEAFRKALKR